MSGLPREILKWMQSLDLSYSVKNVKRDFANGFLIAEIFSRYYKNDITMHSFDNGIGLNKRFENWELLEKFFKKHSIPIEKSVIENVIHCKPDAAIVLMQQVYTALTHKTVQWVRPAKDSDVLPSFARPTASQAVKTRLSVSDLTGKSVDSRLAPAQAAAIIATHEKSNKIEKLNDPQRYSINKPPAGVANANNNATTIKPNESTILLKEVQVKQVQLSPALATSAAPNPLSASSFSPAPNNNDAASPAQSGVSVPQGNNALQVLSSCLLNIFTEINQLDVIDTLKQRLTAKEKDIILPFFRSHLITVSDEFGASVIQQLNLQTTGMLADLSIANPKELWIIVGLLFEILTTFQAQSLVYYETIQFISLLGIRILQQSSFDATLSSSLFFDFIFPKYLQLIQKQGSTKLYSVVKIVYAYVNESPEDHLNVLALFQDSVTDINLLLRMVSNISTYENKLLAQQSLVKGYLDIVEKGLKESSPVTRALALSILAPLSASPYLPPSALSSLLDFVRPLLPFQQPTRRTDDEWMIHAEIVHIIASLYTNTNLLTPTLQNELTTWITQYLSSPSPLPFACSTLSHLSILLGTQPAIRKLWIDLLASDNEIRTHFLSKPSSLTVPSSQHLDYFYIPLREIWQPLIVVQSLADTVRVEHLDNLSVGHFEILYACLQDTWDEQQNYATLTSLQASEIGEWTAIFTQLRDHILVGLCDVELCDSSINILRFFLYSDSLSSTGNTIFQPNDQAPPPLYCIMRFMFPDSEEIPQQQLATFLDELAKRNSTLSQLVFTNLKNFAEFESDKFQVSNLNTLLTKLQATGGNVIMG